MLSDMLKDLKKAVDSKDEKESARLYRYIESLGMDRFTANILITDDTNINVVSISK